MIKQVMKNAFFTGTLLAGLLATPLWAAERYVFDSSHSQVVFSYNHIGFSTTYGMFSGFKGEAMLDMENPANSSVTATFDTKSLITGWDRRTNHLLSDAFFNAEEYPVITFTSTKVEPQDDKTAIVTGNLELNGQTMPVTLNVTLNKMANHPMAGRPWAGFDAETTLKRSDFDMGAFTPTVGDEVKLMISVEMTKAE